MNDSVYVTLYKRTFDQIQDNAEAIYVIADYIETKLTNHFNLLENEVLLEDKTVLLGMALAIKQLSDPIVTSVDKG